MPKFSEIITADEKRKINALIADGTLHEANMPVFINRFVRAPDRAQAFEHARDGTLVARIHRDVVGISKAITDPGIGIRAAKQFYEEKGIVKGTAEIAASAVTTPIRAWGSILGGQGLGENPLETLIGAASIVPVGRAAAGITAGGLKGAARAAATAGKVGRATKMSNLSNRLGAFSKHRLWSPTAQALEASDIIVGAEEWPLELIGEGVLEGGAQLGRVGAERIGQGRQDPLDEQADADAMQDSIDHDQMTGSQTTPQTSWTPEDWMRIMGQERADADAALIQATRQYQEGVEIPQSEAAVTDAEARAEAHTAADQQMAVSDKASYTRLYRDFYNDMAGGQMSEAIKQLDYEYELGIRDPIRERYDQIADSLQEQMGVSPSLLHEESEKRLRRQIGEKWYKYYRGRGHPTLDPQPTPAERVQEMTQQADQIASQPVEEVSITDETPIESRTARTVETDTGQPADRDGSGNVPVRPVTGDVQRAAEPTQVTEETQPQVAPETPEATQEPSIRNEVGEELTGADLDAYVGQITDNLVGYMVSENMPDAEVEAFIQESITDGVQDGMISEEDARILYPLALERVREKLPAERQKAEEYEQQSADVDAQIEAAIPNVKYTKDTATIRGNEVEGYNIEETGVDYANIFVFRPSYESKGWSAYESTTGQSLVNNKIYDTREQAVRAALGNVLFTGEVDYREAMLEQQATPAEQPTPETPAAPQDPGEKALSKIERMRANREAQPDAQNVATPTEAEAGEAAIGGEQEAQGTVSQESPLETPQDPGEKALSKIERMRARRQNQNTLSDISPEQREMRNEYLELTIADEIEALEGMESLDDFQQEVLGALKNPATDELDALRNEYVELTMADEIEALQGMDDLDDFQQEVLGALRAGLTEEQTQPPAETPTEIPQPTGNPILGSLEDTPAMRTALWVAEKLKSGTPFTREELIQQANQQWGGTFGEGAYELQEAFDAMEVGGNIQYDNDPQGFLEAYNATPESAEQAIKIIRVLEDRVLPTPSRRDLEKIQAQQFSTPWHYAFLANWVANLQSNDVVLEPSAGTGNLAWAARRSEIEVHVNEIAERRLNILREQGFRNITNHDARQLANLMASTNPGFEPTVVVMNPPFSANVKTGAKNEMLGANMVTEGLKMLAPGGRLVAIVSGGHPGFENSVGMAFNGSQQTQDWWAQTRREYTVRANMSVSGQDYEKFGTHYDTRLLVIDKPAVGESLSTDPAVTGRVEHVSELPALLEGVRDARAQDAGARTDVVESTPVESQGEGAAEQIGRGRGDTLPGDPIRATTREMGTTEPTGIPTDGTDTVDATRAEGDITERPARLDRGVDAQPIAERGDDVPDGDPVGPIGRSETDSGTVQQTQVAGQGRRTDTGESDRADAVVDDDTRLTASEGTYTPIPEAHIEGTPLVMPSMLAAVRSPDVSNIEMNIPNPEGLSEAQVVAVKRILRVHEYFKGDTRDPDSQIREGYYNGWGTGGGKTRIFSSVILHNIAAGRKKHIVLTETADLVPKFKVDYKALGGDDTKIYLHSGTNFGEKIKTGDGVFVSPYSTLRGDGKTSKNPEPWGRLAQILEWAVGEKPPASLLGGASVSVSGDLPTLPDNISDAVQQREQFTEVPALYALLSNYQSSLERGATVRTLEKFEDNYNEIRDQVEEIRSRDQQEERLSPQEWQQRAREFDGVIVMDEAHNAKNAKAKNASQQALAVLMIQRMLPNARVAYMSATGTVTLADAGYLERVGLFGPGTPFTSFEEMEATLGTRTALAELAISSLKERGQFDAATLSYDGVGYDQVVHALTEREVEAYGELADIWRTLLLHIRDYEDRYEDIASEAEAGGMGSVKSRTQSAYYGANQRFWISYMMALQLRSTIPNAIEHVKAGDKVVFSLVNTNDASQDRAVARAKSEGKDVEEFPVDLSEPLLQFINRSFPTAMLQPNQNESGKPVMGPVVRGGIVVPDQNMLEVKNEMLRKVNDLDMPENPLNYIVQAFRDEGIEIAEVTGRKERYIWAENEDGEPERVTEDKLGKRQPKDIERFLDGDLRALVYSGKGATGRDYHSLPGQPRHHLYVVQVGWSPLKLEQSIGRVHRTGQSQPPMIYLARTNAPGEERVMSSAASRLKSMGATSSGSAEATGGGSLIADEIAEYMQEPIGKTAFYNMMARLYEGRHSETEGLIDVPDLEIERMDDDGNVVVDTGRLNFQEVVQLLDIPIDLESGQFTEKSLDKEMKTYLNRIMNIAIPYQHAISGVFFRELADLIAQAKEAGTLDRGAEVLNTTEAAVVRDTLLDTDSQSGAQTRMLELDVAYPVRKTKVNDLQRMIAHAPRQGTGRFLRFITLPRGGLVAVFRSSSRIDGDQVVPRFKLTGVSTTSYASQGEPRVQNSKDEGTEFTEELQSRWETQETTTPDTTQGKVHLATGQLIQNWDRLSMRDSEARHQADISDSVKVQRIMLSAGGQVLGRVIPPGSVSNVLSRFDATLGETTGQNLPAPEKPKHTLDSLIPSIMEGNPVRLQNGWELTSATRDGEPLLMLRRAGRSPVQTSEDMEALGLRSISGSGGLEWFVPRGDTTVLENLLKRYPPRDVEITTEESTPPRDDDPDDGGDTGGGNTPPPTPTPTPAPSKQQDAERVVGLLDQLQREAPNALTGDKLTEAQELIANAKDEIQKEAVELLDQLQREAPNALTGDKLTEAQELIANAKDEIQKEDDTSEVKSTPVSRQRMRESMAAADEDFSKDTDEDDDFRGESFSPGDRVQGNFKRIVVADKNALLGVTNSLVNNEIEHIMHGLYAPDSAGYGVSWFTEEGWQEYGRHIVDLLEANTVAYEIQESQELAPNYRDQYQVIEAEEGDLTHEIHKLERTEPETEKTAAQREYDSEHATMIELAKEGISYKSAILDEPRPTTEETTEERVKAGVLSAIADKEDSAFRGNRTTVEVEGIGRVEVAEITKWTASVAPVGDRMGISVPEYEATLHITSKERPIAFTSILIDVPNAINDKYAAEFEQEFLVGMRNPEVWDRMGRKNAFQHPNGMIVSIKRSQYSRGYTAEFSNIPNDWSQGFTMPNVAGENLTERLANALSQIDPHVFGYKSLEKVVETLRGETGQTETDSESVDLTPHLEMLGIAPNLYTQMTPEQKWTAITEAYDSALEGSIEEGLEVPEDKIKALNALRDAARDEELGTLSDVTADSTANIKKILDTMQASPTKARVRGVRDHIKKGLPLNLIGHSVRSAEEAAVLGQLVRDPQVETTWIVYRKGGRVLKVEPHTLNRAKVTPAGEIRHVSKMLKELEADDFVRIHNHPSAVARFSSDDKTKAREWREHFGDQLAEEVVVDSGTYAAANFANNTFDEEVQLPPERAGWDTSVAPIMADFDPEGREGVREGDPLYANPLARGARDVAMFGDGLKNDPGWTTVFSVSKDGSVEDMSEHNEATLRELTSLARKQREKGGEIHISAGRVTTGQREILQQLGNVDGIGSVWTNGERVSDTPTTKDDRNTTVTINGQEHTLVRMPDESDNLSDIITDLKNWWEKLTKSDKARVRKSRRFTKPVVIAGVEHKLGLDKERELHKDFDRGIDAEHMTSGDESKIFDRILQSGIIKATHPTGTAAKNAYLSYGPYYRKNKDKHNYGVILDLEKMLRNIPTITGTIHQRGRWHTRRPINSIKEMRRILREHQIGHPDTVIEIRVPEDIDINTYFAGVVMDSEVYAKEEYLVENQTENQTENQFSSEKEVRRIIRSYKKDITRMEASLKAVFDKEIQKETGKLSNVEERIRERETENAQLKKNSQTSNTPYSDKSRINTNDRFLKQNKKERTEVMKRIAALRNYDNVLSFLTFDKNQIAKSLTETRRSLKRAQIELQEIRSPRLQQRKGVLLRDIGGTQQQFVKADTDTFSDVNRPSDTTFQKPAVIAGVSYELIRDKTREDTSRRQQGDAEHMVSEPRIASPTYLHFLTFKGRFTRLAKENKIPKKEVDNRLNRLETIFRDGDIMSAVFPGAADKNLIEMHKSLFRGFKESDVSSLSETLENFLSENEVYDAISEEGVIRASHPSGPMGELLSYTSYGSYYRKNRTKHNYGFILDMEQLLNTIPGITGTVHKRGSWEGREILNTPEALREAFEKYGEDPEAVIEVRIPQDIDINQYMVGVVENKEVYVKPEYSRGTTDVTTDAGTLSDVTTDTTEVGNQESPLRAGSGIRQMLGMKSRQGTRITRHAFEAGFGMLEEMKARQGQEAQIGDKLYASVLSMEDIFQNEFAKESDRFDALYKEFDAFLRKRATPTPLSRLNPEKRAVRSQVRAAASDTVWRYVEDNTQITNDPDLLDFAKRFKEMWRELQILGVTAMLEKQKEVKTNHDEDIFIIDSAGNRVPWYPETFDAFQWDAEKEMFTKEGRDYTIEDAHRRASKLYTPHYFKHHVLRQEHAKVAKRLAAISTLEQADDPGKLEGTLKRLDLRKMADGTYLFGITGDAFANIEDAIVSVKDYLSQRDQYFREMLEYHDIGMRSERRGQGGDTIGHYGQLERARETQDKFYERNIGLLKETRRLLWHRFAEISTIGQTHPFDGNSPRMEQNIRDVRAFRKNARERALAAVASALRAGQPDSMYERLPEFARGVNEGLHIQQDWRVYEEKEVTDPKTGETFTERVKTDRYNELDIDRMELPPKHLATLERIGFIEKDSDGNSKIAGDTLAERQLTVARFFYEWYNTISRRENRVRQLFMSLGHWDTKNPLERDEGEFFQKLNDVITIGTIGLGTSLQNLVESAMLVMDTGSLNAAKGINTMMSKEKRQTLLHLASAMSNTPRFLTDTAMGEKYFSSKWAFFTQSDKLSRAFGLGVGIENAKDLMQKYASATGRQKAEWKRAMTAMNLNTGIVDAAIAAGNLPSAIKGAEDTIYAGDVDMTGAPETQQTLAHAMLKSGRFVSNETFKRYDATSLPPFLLKHSPLLRVFTKYKSWMLQQNREQYKRFKNAAVEAKRGNVRPLWNLLQGVALISGMYAMMNLLWASDREDEDSNRLVEGMLDAQVFGLAAVMMQMALRADGNWFRMQKDLTSQLAGPAASITAGVVAPILTGDFLQAGEQVLYRVPGVNVAKRATGLRLTEVFEDADQDQ